MKTALIASNCASIKIDDGSGELWNGMDMGYQTQLLGSVAEVCSALWSFVEGLSHIFGSANGVRGIKKLCSYGFGSQKHNSGKGWDSCIGCF